MRKEFEYDLEGSKINFDTNQYGSRDNSELYGDMLGGDIYLDWDSEYIPLCEGDYDTPPSGGYYVVHNIILVTPDFIIEPKGKWLDSITSMLEEKLNN
jgi:hypothetical protein